MSEQQHANSEQSDSRTDAEIVAALRRLNPLGGYRLPRNTREAEAQRKTLGRLEATAKGRRS